MGNSQSMLNCCRTHYHFLLLFFSLSVDGGLYWCLMPGPVFVLEVNKSIPDADEIR